ncbi:hypothetical protein [Nonomuraea aurantiaca]|uniref:hypothetical protein n=1 Tax=Nonomuraea aurantiaca TaxID=2878562 RepID=UPI001CDA3937|nr:hypothetical protein [Nonomuraea aurantiaca]MCA2228632.1 hypothetical protein [Nonomuraea aurantiaca]
MYVAEFLEEGEGHLPLVVSQVIQHIGRTDAMFSPDIGRAETGGLQKMRVLEVHHLIVANIAYRDGQVGRWSPTAAISRDPRIVDRPKHVRRPTEFMNISLVAPRKQSFAAVDPEDVADPFG